MKANLTERQMDLYKFIREHLMQNGTAPSVEEMRVGIDLKSKSGVVRLINGLVERGWVGKMPGRARTLVLLQEPVIATIDLTDPILREALIMAGWTPPQPQEKAA